MSMRSDEETTIDGQGKAAPPVASPTCVSIDWYAEGESRVVEVDGVRITVRFVGRRGRRGRIAIEAPAGAVFMSGLSETRSM
jgi:hypothetical protein